MEIRDLAQHVIDAVNGVILGKETQVRQMMLAFLAGGHILLADMPGVGKTTAAQAYANVMALDCKRMQFTPDVLPSDITGFSFYQKEKKR